MAMEPISPPPWKRPKVANASTVLEWMRIEHRQIDTNEHRLLIFRSSVPGVVAKIIWTSRDSRTAAAKIEDLHVKDSYRGFDLGGLLFLQAVQLLQKSAHKIQCELEAEEDSRRHNRLLAFYQSLGCSVKDNVKMQYLYNNDGETYRKIPMKIDTSRIRGYEMIGRTFCPVHLLQTNGQQVIVQQKSSHHWLLTTIYENMIQLRTTRGQYLVVDENGNCLVIEHNQSNSPSPTNFQLLQHESSCLWHIQVMLVDNDKKKRPILFLEISNHGTFQCVNSPRYWKLFQSNVFVFSHETPWELHHMELFEQIQTIEYVHRMRQQYCCSFDNKHRRMTLKHALDSLEKRFYRDVSFRTRCFRAAQLFREYGHPDWVQLVALLYFLGTIATLIESEKSPVTPTLPSSNNREADFDWTIPVRSKVVGSYTRTDRCSNQVTESKSESAKIKMQVPSHCCLDNIVLAWTGPEYMYHMVIHNEIAIPNEGLALLRLAAMVDCQTLSSSPFIKSCHSSPSSRIMKHADVQPPWYRDLDDVVEMSTTCAVAEFATILQLSQDSGNETSLTELSTNECEELWETHYAAIAAKYGAGGVLHW
jgi:GNAT superfamily N-acetyltransferase